jgi:DNA-binding CsgD family transcriptional regulator
MPKNTIEKIMGDYLSTLSVQELSDYLGRSVLTVREKECLHWICQGKTSEEVAIILQLTPHTTRTYLGNVKRKLGSKTIAQAIYRALRFKQL